MSKLDYDSKIETIQAIPDAECKSPHMPVDAYLQEAENQYQWCQDDKQNLTNAGLDWSYVDDLPVRAGALREGQPRYRARGRAVGDQPGGRSGWRRRGQPGATRRARAWFQHDQHRLRPGHPRRPRSR